MSTCDVPKCTDCGLPVMPDDESGIAGDGHFHLECPPKEVMHALVVQEAETPHFCDACDKLLKAGDEIAHTYDMSRMWHRNCLKPFVCPPLVHQDIRTDATRDPYAWCRQRPGETQLEARERMLANVPPGLKRNVSEPCVIASYFGYERRGAQ